MKPFLFLITCATAAILMVAGCSKQKPSVLVEPHAGIGKVQKGMNETQIEAALGKPETKNGNAWFYRKRGMFVMFGGNGVMFNIQCVSPFDGKTKEGIGIGSTRDELIAAYGNPGETKHFQKFDDLWFPTLGINFDLEQDKVTSFIVHLNAQ